MFNEVNTNRGYYKPSNKMYYSSNSYSDGSKSRSYTRDNLPGSTNPTFTKDVDMRQLNYTATNYAADSYDSAWSSNTRKANQAPMNTLNSYSTSSGNISGATNLLDKGQYNYRRSDGIQGQVSTSKVVRSTYADSFVTYNMNNQDPMPTLHTMKTDTVSDFVNPIQNYNTQKSIPDSYVPSGHSLWQNKEKNTSIRVVPAVEHRGRPQNPDDSRFVLFPKEPTFNVKIIGGVRIAQQVIKISYRKSLKSTAVYTIGRKGGSCKKALAESKRKRALWWIAHGKPIEEAILLCLRPYHEIYEEILEKKHSWGTPMMIRNLLEQINKEGVYNPFIGRPHVNDSETSDDSADEATEQLIKPQDESNQDYPFTNNKLGINVQENIDQNSRMLRSLPTQNNIQIQNLPTQQEIGNSSSQNASYDPTRHFLNSLADRNRSLPVNSKPVSDSIHMKTDNYSLSGLADNNRPFPVNSKPVSHLIHTKTDNYSLNSPADRNRQPVNSEPVSDLIFTKTDNCNLGSVADCNRQPVNSEPVSDLIFTKTDNCNLGSVADHNRQPVISGPVRKLFHTTKANPYTKVNTKTKTIMLKKDIKGAALRRYYYWLNVGKTPEVAKALCVLRMNQIPLYQQVKDTVGTLKNFVKTRQNQAKFRGILSVADTDPASMVDKAGYCDNINNISENVYAENPQEVIISENTEGAANELQNVKTSKTQVYLDEIEQYMKTLRNNNKKYKKIFEPVAIDKYRWWRHVGRTVKEAQEMCLHPFHRFPKEHEEGVKIIDFRTYILEEAANLNIADNTPKCPTKLKGHKKLRYNHWIKLGKTPKEAIDLTFQDTASQRKTSQYMERVNKRKEYLSTFPSSGNYTIEEHFTKDIDDYDLAPGPSTGDYKNNIQTFIKKTEAAVGEVCIPSYKEGRNAASNTYIETKSIIPDLLQNPRREDTSNLGNKFGENFIETDAMTETSFPQNIVAQEGHNLPITQNLVVPSYVKASEQGEFRVCIKANKDNIDFDNLKAIKNSLNLCIADEDGIQIKSFNKRSNRVIITCLNEQTRDWLDKQIPTLVPWENAQLEIINEDEVPIDILARFFVPFDTEAECSSVTPEQFMQQLHDQNPDVGCDRWIMHKVEMKTDPIGFYVLGCIDNKSNDVLTSKNNKLKWFDKRNIKVKISSTNKKRKAVSAARAILFIPKVPECRLHSSQQYLLNRLHKLNPTVGCDEWTIVQKRIKPDGAALLVRLNNASKHKVENIKKLQWYRSQNIVITIVPIYVNINLPIDNESKYLRNMPQNQITKTLTNKLHFFNPSFGCLKWVVVQVQDKVDEWHTTFKINEQCHQTLINSDYKLHWYGGRWLEIKLGTVPELEMFESKNDTKRSKKPATSYKLKENVTERNINRIVSGSMLSPQLMVSEKSKAQDVSNRGLPPPMLWNNPEKHPDVAMLSSSRQDRTADVSYTEREPYHNERRNRVGPDCNETHQPLPALEYAMPEIPEYARPPDRHDQGYLGIVRFREKEDMAQDSHRFQRYDDEDRDICLEDRYRLQSNRDAYYPNTEYRNVENVDYNNDDCNENYYKNENRMEEEEIRHSPYHNSDNIYNTDPRSNDEYMHQDIEGYNFDQHHHDRVDKKEIDYEREERHFDRGERHFDREENNFDRGDRHVGREENNFNSEGRTFNTEERYYDRGGINFERGQRYFDREKSPQDGPRLNLEHRFRQETEYFQGKRTPDHQNSERGQRYFAKEKSPQDGASLELKHRSPQETGYFQSEWSPDHENKSNYVDRRKRSHSRDNQRQQNFSHLRPKHREVLHYSRESLNLNKCARVSEDRRHDALIERLKGLADYHDRAHHHESSSYSSHKRQNARPSFDESPSKRRRPRR